MKKLFVSIFSALLLLLTLTGTAFATQTTEKEQVHFKSNFTAIETLYFDANGGVTDTGSGSGNATTLGRFTFTYRVEFDPNDPQAGILYYHFVAANGDSLYSSGPGVGEDVGPDMGHVVETHTITGGTGRFAGASGTLTVDRLIQWTWTDTGGTGVTYGTIKGDLFLADD